MNQNKLSNLLNNEFPMHPAYHAFEASVGGGARFTNPMEWRDDVTYFKVYQDNQGFQVVVENSDLFSKSFNDLESMCKYVEKLSRLKRRMTPKEKLEAELQLLLFNNADVLNQIEELKRMIAFYS